MHPQREWVVPALHDSMQVIATVRGDPGSLLPGMGLYLATPSRPSPPANPGRGVRTGGSPGVASHCDIDQGVLAAALTACHFSTGGLTGAGEYMWGRRWVHANSTQQKVQAK